MVVDREQLSADLLARVIQSFGLQVIGTFWRAKQFLRAIENNTPSLVVLDAGFPAASRVTRELATRNPPVSVVVLDDVFRNDRFNLAPECGAQGYLTRRDSLDDFGASLQRLALTRVSTAVRSDCHGKQCIRNPAFLTDREIMVLRLAVAGRTVHESAEGLGITQEAVNIYKTRIARKLNSRREAGRLES